MEKLAHNITQLIQQNNSNFSELEIKKIEFGLTCLFGEITKFLIYLVIFSIFSQAHTFLIATFFFCTLRLVAGGYHEETYWACFLSSLFIFSTILTIGMYLNLLPSVRMLMLIISIILVWRYAPVDHPNKPVISKVRRRNLKYLSVVVTILLGGVSFLLTKGQAVVAITAVLFEAFSLPIGEFSKRGCIGENIKR